MNNMDQDPNQPASGNPMQGSQGSETVDERGKPSNMHWETIASPMKVETPACNGKLLFPGVTRDMLKVETFKSPSRRRSILWTECGRPSQKEVTRIVRHRDQDEREQDGAVHWDTTLLMLKRRFQSQSEDEGKSMDWVKHLQHGSQKTIFEIRKNADNELV